MQSVDYSAYAWLQSAMLHHILPNTSGSHCYVITIKDKVTKLANKAEIYEIH